MNNFKRAFYFVASMLLVLCTVACGGSPKAPLLPEDITVLIAPDANLAVTLFAEKLSARISEETGKETSVVTQKDESETFYVSLGVDRELFAPSDLQTGIPDFGKTLTTVTGYGFTLSEKEGTLSVIGSDETALYFAVKKVMDEMLSDGRLSVPENFLYTTGGEWTANVSAFIESGNCYFQPCERITLLDKEVVAAFPGLQGAGTDGSYGYYAAKTETGPETSLIVKISLPDGKIVDTSEWYLPTFHSNDMTYVPEFGSFIIIHCIEDDGWVGASYINPETLKLTGSFNLPLPSRGIEYIPSEEKYITAAQYSLSVFDKNFTLLYQFTCGDPRGTTQGLCSDGEYIYDTRSLDDGGNFIAVHSLDGVYKCSPEVGVVNGEAENIFRVKNDFYIGFNNHPAEIYRFILLPEEFRQ